MVNKKAFGNLGIVLAVILILGGAYLLLDRQPTEDIIVEETVIPFENIKEEVPEMWYEEEEQLFITSAEEYEEIFGEETDIDFNENVVVAVFFGEQPTGGYNIEITEVTETEDNVIIYVLETYPGDCPVIQVITAPYDVVLIECMEKTPEFVFEQTFLDC